MSKPRKCPTCSATAAEVRRYGHRRFDADGLMLPAKDNSPRSRACPQACTCVPEHVTLAEHRKACQ